MTTVEKETLSARLENSFLGILRVVILVVLTISLIASLIFGYLGLSNLTASPDEYEYKDPKISDMVDEIKKTLEVKPTESPTEQPKPEEEKKKDQKLDQEIEKQVKLISEFLQRYNRNLTNRDAFRDGLKENAMTLAFDPEDESSVMDYAEGQTEIFEKVLTDKKILEIVDKRQQEILIPFFRVVTETYPNYFRKERQKKAKFDQEQEMKALGERAGAAMNLYIAAAMFGTFLLISLILVLVKIERNLRVRPI
jgi:hypothetical protein